jgi:hypothetical protein
MGDFSKMAWVSFGSVVPIKKDSNAIDVHKLYGYHSALLLWIENMRRKFVIFLVEVCGFILAVMCYLVQYNIYKRADISFLGSSGDYRLEYVAAELPYTYINYAYIRVIDIAHPDHVYRSPIAAALDIDVKGFETDKKINMGWLVFDKEKHSFLLAFPGWRESWINLFISNTPYAVIENG